MTDAEMKAALHRLTKVGSGALDDDQFHTLVACLRGDKRLGQVAVVTPEGPDLSLINWFRTAHAIEAERFTPPDFPGQEVLDLLIPVRDDHESLLIRVLDQSMVAIYTGMYRTMEDVRRHRALTYGTPFEEPIGGVWQAPTGLTEGAVDAE